MIQYIESYWVIIITMLGVVIEGFINYHDIESGSDPHTVAMWVRRLTGLGLLTFFSGHLYNAATIPVMFWLPFDLFLNYLRQKPFLYVGQTHWFDKVQYNFKFAAFFWKLVLLAGAISWVLTDGTGYW